MSDTPHIDPDLTSGAADDEQQEAPDVETTSPKDVDPRDGTDEDDLPVDNPAG
jgi:hypothetical protein